MSRPLTASDFDYYLPAELIAQHPLPDRSASRLLVIDRANGTITHKRFTDFPSYLNQGDALVLNTSRVIPARLHATRTNGRDAEVLLVHPERDGTWWAMVRPGGKLKTGRSVRFGLDATAEVVEVNETGGGLRRLRFSGRLDVPELMEKYGSIPLPPYIDRSADDADRDRYQTVFARENGSVAAPTAGLHFTPEVLSTVRDRGAAVAELVLHVGPGTFKPVEVEDPSRHPMHAEHYVVPAAVAETVNAASRVIAVGTTVTRTLETVGKSGAVVPGDGWTSLFIYPPFEFQVVDVLLTNFHLPRSSLLMLVAAFAGHDLVMGAYAEAVKEQYRFYSYGDAMLIV